MYVRRVISILIIFKIIDTIFCTSNTDEVKVCNSNNCKLPRCKCSSREIPGSIDLAKTPMMVALSFNGVINKNIMSSIEKIIDFKNPDTCPIKATFFVNDRVQRLSTKYCLVQNLFDVNNEIAISVTLNNDSKYTSLVDAVKRQKSLLLRNTKISKFLLKGFRMPSFLQGIKRELKYIKLLEKNQFVYDSSIVIEPRNFSLWPHTLQYQPNYEFKNWEMSHIWEVPLSFYNLNDNLSPLEKSTEESIAEFLYEKFERHYINKSPMVINIETDWLEKFSKKITNALRRFIGKFATKPGEQKRYKKDVYFLTISDIISWMENPDTLDKMARKWIWSCDFKMKKNNCASFKFDKVANEEHILSRHQKSNNTEPRHSEVLFADPVLAKISIIFLIATILVISYDKFSKTFTKISDVSIDMNRTVI